MWGGGYKAAWSLNLSVLTAGVKKECSCTCTSRVCFHGVYKDDFTYKADSVGGRRNISMMYRI